MPKDNSGAPLARREKIILSGLCLVFCLAFAAVTVFSVVGIAGELNGWYYGRSWQPAMADIGETNLIESGRKRSGSRHVQVTYRYHVDGVTFEGNRIGWSDSIWSVFSDWHEDRYHELIETRNDGKRAIVWYNPANPGMAVFDRDLRWGVLLFLLPLGLFFSAVSLAAWWVARNLWRPD